MTTVAISNAQFVFYLRRMEGSFALTWIQTCVLQLSPDVRNQSLIKPLYFLLYLIYPKKYFYICFCESKHLYKATVCSQDFVQD